MHMHQRAHTYICALHDVLNYCCSAAACIVLQCGGIVFCCIITPASQEFLAIKNHVELVHHVDKGIWSMNMQCEVNRSFSHRDVSDMHCYISKCVFLQCRWEWLESGAGAPTLAAASLPPNKSGPWVSHLLVALDCLLSCRRCNCTVKAHDV